MSEGNNTEYKMSAKEWLENFWYHYKWHSIVAIFVVIAITVCSVQFCSRTDYDIYVMYAGGGELKKTSEDGDTPEYQKAISSLTRYADDYDENGSVALSLLTLFVPSEDEIAAIRAEGGDVNYALIYDDSQSLNDNMVYSKYYLCFLSEDLFLQHSTAEVQAFDKIADYADPNAEYEYVGEYGIRLSSLPIYSRDGIKNLPDNTVVCIRRLGAVSTRFDSDQEKAYLRAGEMLRELLK